MLLNILKAVLGKEIIPSVLSLTGMAKLSLVKLMILFLILSLWFRCFLIKQTVNC